MKLHPWNYARVFGRRFIQDFKDRSFLTLRLWTDHCEYIMAQRIRRGQQIVTFYNRIWGEKAFRDLIKGLRKQVQRHIKGIMLSSVGIYAFDWDINRIHNDLIRSYLNEIDFVEKLSKETLICSMCNKRKIISEKIDGMEYCKCTRNQNNENKMKKCSNDNNNNNRSNKMNGWEPYLEKDGMMIWRREEKPSLFAYKVYVKYTDITAEDFLQVQTDIEYRKKWDDTALALEVIDTDPEDAEESQVIYWEMRWPKLFANRDYVYIRRCFTDKERNLTIICNKSTNHPKCPINPNKQRVNEYWSYMVIKPFQSFQQPGLEFVLTYFDDPGLAIPSTITSWVAQKQMPEFLYKLYFATKDYAEHKKHEMHKKSLTSWNSYRISSSKESEINEKTELGAGKQQQQHHHHNYHRMKMNRDDHENDKTEENFGVHNQINNGDDNAANNDQETALEIEQLQQEKKSWWSYLRPLYYFA